MLKGVRVSMMPFEDYVPEKQLEIVDTSPLSGRLHISLESRPLAIKIIFNDEWIVYH